MKALGYLMAGLFLAGILSLPVVLFGWKIGKFGSASVLATILAFTWIMAAIYFINGGHF